MIFIDVIGLLTTVCLIGLRYPQYVVLAALVHMLGMLILGIVLHGKVEYIVAAGAFSTAVFSNFKFGTISNLFIFSGVLSNYIAMSLWGGIEKEKTRNLLNPTSQLSSPWAVINLRMAIVSLLFNLWNIFYGV